MLDDFEARVEIATVVDIDLISKLPANDRAAHRAARSIYFLAITARRVS